MTTRGLIDAHVHLAALPTESNGCWISPRMLKTPVARMVAWSLDLPLDDAQTANRRYLERLETEFAASESVEKAVLLAMDGVYDAQGRLDKDRTDFLISNDTLLETVASRPQFLAGVSINPFRRDALDELERCAERGAKLVKVLPNAQMFDPGDGRLLRFYRRLGELKLPLLSHIGYEFSLIGQDQSVGDPDRLIGALEEGATVIAAHGFSQGLFFVEKHFKTMLQMVRRYKNFYSDLSALTLPNRVGALIRISRRPELFERLVFGTDYPLPCFSYPAILGGGFQESRRATNRFDRQLRVFQSLGVKPQADLGALLAQ